jgi:hypothetical protein
MENIGELETYVKEGGYPLIRRCLNCVHWNDETEFHPRHKVGYCKLKAYFFAFTLEANVYPITKEFFLCENHKFYDEGKLQNDVSVKKVKTKEILKKKNEL